METILLWITGALLCGLICKYFSLPVVVGFIAAGYCFGTTSFTDHEGILTIPSEIGVELLLFSLGLKIDPFKYNYRHEILRGTSRTDQFPRPTGYNFSRISGYSCIIFTFV